jgi:hypothetical protein
LVKLSAMRKAGQAEAALKAAQAAGLTGDREGFPLPMAAAARARQVVFTKSRWLRGV